MECTGNERGLPAETPPRVVIEHVSPAVEGGRFAVKRILNDTVTVEATAFADGHDLVAARLVVWPPDGPPRTAPMQLVEQDRWRATFAADQLGTHRFAVEASVDDYGSWLDAFKRRLAAGQPMEPHLTAGAELIRSAAARAAGEAQRERMSEAAIAIERASRETAVSAAEAAIADVAEWPDPLCIATTQITFPVLVERARAASGAWYELFPRSAGAAGRHGTFADVERQLPAIARMGFDVLHLPPIHPIGVTGRKGPNNTLNAGPGDPGSPWAIGSSEGGHTAVHPALGTLADFRHMRHAAAAEGLEIALDIAFQCSPDHPWVAEHPEWFTRLPDGSISHAENPPKRYEDIVPFNFANEDWKALWQALLDIFRFWANEGIRIFRVDNPHTKPFAFWEWALAQVREEYPDAIFLAEAFTRPNVSQRLAKLGFSQSYTYFAWRNTAEELRDYFSGLATPEMRDYFRANLWPNTPDILTGYLQTGGEGAFRARLVLAATLGASYGIYGPAFEHFEDRARESGSEEYLDSEKYQLRAWGPDPPLAPLITRLNAIRASVPALVQAGPLEFFPLYDPDLLVFARTDSSGRERALVAVNLDLERPARFTLPTGDVGDSREQRWVFDRVFLGPAPVADGGQLAVDLGPGEASICTFRAQGCHAPVTQPEVRA